MDIDGDVEAKEEKSGKEKKKKDKKAKKEKKQKEQQQNGETEDGQQEAEKGAAPKQKAARFIVFVGNLPYSANTESLKAHFEKIQPISVRVATQPDKPTKSRGFGFVEFDNYDRMKTCLKLYHHSSFDDGKYPPRRINVELTAGGGGKSEHRKAKIEYKNQKLAEERKRQAKETQTEKVVKKAKAEENPADDYANIHPSRRPRMA
ncbi:RNA-binding protein [Aspergillus undulatus]|uniref:RNA-binding protein n=1 Tax=Aspergillus undulatus TaxID=1810928 RepID=UPI003CCD9915